MRSRRGVPVLGVCVTLTLAAATWAQEDVLEHADRSKGEEWQIKQREKWFIETRGLDKVSRPDLLRAAAIEDLRRRLDEAPGQTLTWQSLGPDTISTSTGPVAGRVSAIALHPSNENIIYLGTASGGLWKTTTGGTSWTEIFSQVGTQMIGSIFIDPANTNTIWVGTGDHWEWCGRYFGMGLFKSTDGGATWQAMNGWGPNKLKLSYISSIVVHPTNPNIVLVGGYAWCDNFNEGALYRSTDGGTNWYPSISGAVGDILVDPTTPDTMYAGVGRSTYSTNGVYKTLNAGASWARIETAPLPYGTSTYRVRLAMAPSNGQVIYALILQSDGRTPLYKTTNGGATWSQTNPDACDWQCSYNLCLAVHPTNPDSIVVGSVYHYRSTDSGTTLTLGASYWVVHVDTHVLRYSTTNGGRYWIGNDGGLWRTDNGGTSFTNLNANLNITQFYDVAVHPGDTLAVWGGAQDNGSSGRFGSQQWTGTVGTGDGMMNLVDPANPNTVFQSSYPYPPSGPNRLPRLVRSTTGGSPSTFSWLAQNGLIGGEPYPWVTPLAIYDHDASTPTYAFLASNYVYRAQTDQPTSSFTWTKISPDLGGISTVIAPVKSGSNLVIYAGTSNGKIQRTDNGLDPSPTWSDVTGNLPCCNVSDIAPDPTNPLRVFATRGNFDIAKLWRSTTGGTTWTAVGIWLPNLPANSVAIDPLNVNRIFVGTDVGVYESLDGGDNVHALMSGLPLGTVVTDLEIDDNPHALVAGTYGRGAWWLDLDLPWDLIFRDGFQTP